jgi:hypothetical protein
MDGGEEICAHWHIYAPNDPTCAGTYVAKEWTLPDSCRMTSGEFPCGT